MVDHTPTPWKMVSRPEFSNGLTYTSIQPVDHDERTMRPLAMANGEFHVCRMSHTAAWPGIHMHRANAAFIVQACNSHDDMLAALKAVQKLIAEAAMTGFNCHDGDWADRLFHSQQATSSAIKKATESAKPSLTVVGENG